MEDVMDEEDGEVDSEDEDEEEEAKGRTWGQGHKVRDPHLHPRKQMMHPQDLRKRMRVEMMHHSLSKQQWLAIECLKGEYATPCLLPNQRFECVMMRTTSSSFSRHPDEEDDEGRRLRIRKCRHPDVDRQPNEDRKPGLIRRPTRDSLMRLGSGSGDDLLPPSFPQTGKHHPDSSLDAGHASDPPASSRHSQARRGQGADRTHRTHRHHHLIHEDCEADEEDVGEGGGRDPRSGNKGE